MVSILDSTWFNISLAIIFFLIILFIVYTYGGTNNSQVLGSSTLTKLLTMFLLIFLGLFLIFFIYRSLRNQPQRENDIFFLDKFIGRGSKKDSENKWVSVENWGEKEKPKINWNPKDLRILGKEGKYITVREHVDGLYYNLEDPKDFYRCNNGECEKETPPSDWITQRYPPAPKNNVLEIKLIS